MSNSSLDFANVNMYLVLNNGNPVLIKDAVDAATGKFNIPISASQLQKVNTVSIYAESGSLTSNTLKRQINVGGLLSFGYVQNNIHFQSTNNTFEDKILPRLNNWEINVVDSRENGSQWTVQAQSTKLINKSDGTTLKGNIFYKDPNSLSNQPLDSIDDTGKPCNPITIATHQKDTDIPETTNITNPWTSDSGILLSMKYGNTPGEYKGEIYWTLLDTI